MSDNKCGDPRKYMTKLSKKAFKASIHCGTYQFQSK